MDPIERLSELSERYPKLDCVKDEIAEAYLVIKKCYDGGGKLLIAGNGGSCADAQHIVGELMKGFCKMRPIPTGHKEVIASLGDVYKDLASKLQVGLPAIALTEHQALNTAYANDMEPDYAIAQQAYGYGREGDVLLLISTSGNSKDLIYAVPAARARGMSVILLTGKDGGKLKDMADIAIVVPEAETYKIQELHLPIYHTLCLMLEDSFFKE